jgi:hypothetical protein
MTITSELPAALDAETVDLRLWPAAGRTDLHKYAMERSRHRERLQERNLFSQCCSHMENERIRSDIQHRTRLDAPYRLHQSHRGKGIDFGSR